MNNAFAVNDDDVPENDDQPGHINEREAVAAVLALETASGPAVLITDSRVVEAAIRRGRSRNVVVNAAVAYIIEQLGLIGVAWVPSATNPADAPSRGHAPDLLNIITAVPSSVCQILHRAP